MRRLPRILQVPVLAVGLAACEVPTDSSESLSVRLAEGELKLVVGETHQLVAEVRGGALDASDVLFTSFDETVVRVSRDGLVLGVGRGEALVVASVRAFEKAATDTVRVEVLDGITFESVHPDTVRFGQTLTIVGSALDPTRLSVLSVGGIPATVRAFAPAKQSDSSSRDTLRIYVPTGAVANGSVVALHVTGASASRPVTVIPEDIYEPNDASPAPITGPTSLENPQLAFEAGSGFDWYRLKGIQGSFTVEVQLRLPVQGFMGGVTLSQPREQRGEAPRWSVTDSEFQRCNGLQVKRERAHYIDEDATNEILQFPVMDPQDDSLDLTVMMYTPPVDPLRYTVRILDGYRSSFPPDSLEPNNHCEQAVEVAGNLETTVSLDSPADAEWFRFSAPPGGLRLSVQAQCRVCEGPVFLDLTVYEDAVTGRPESPDDLPLVVNQYATSNATVNQWLPEGDYFLVLVNKFYDPQEQVWLIINTNPGG